MQTIQSWGEREQIYNVMIKEICNIQKFQSTEVTKCQKESHEFSSSVKVSQTQNNIAISHSPRKSAERKRKSRKISKVLKFQSYDDEERV